jgi:hypothetical protein
MKSEYIAPFWNRSARWVPAIFPMMLLLLAGCDGGGKGRGALNGKVNLDGKPLAYGSILFTPMQGTHGTATGGPIENGQYQLSRADGPAIGWNRVEIRATRTTGKMIPKPFSPPGQMIPEQVEAISSKFNSESTLKVEVKPGDNTADFEVTSCR